MAMTPAQVAAAQQAATAKALGLSTSQYQSAFSKGGWAGAQAASQSAGGGGAPSTSSPLSPNYVGPNVDRSSWGTEVYGANLANSIAQQNGVNPSSLPRQQGGGVTQPDMNNAIQNTQQSNSYQTELDALKAQYLKLQGAYQGLASSAYQPTYYNPVTTPTTPTTPTPNQSTNPVSTTGVQSAQQENPNLGIPSGPGGFTFNDTGAAGATAGTAQGTAQVSPDATYSLWQKLNGGVDNPQMAAYFKSPDWQSIAAGNIPLYMANDDSWRYFLQRMGYMTPAYNTDMQNAINQRLASLQSQQSGSSSGS